VTVDGYAAKLVESTVTADIDRCMPAGEGFWLWASADGDRRYVQGTNELNKIYVGYGLLPNRTFGYGHSFGVLSHYYGREAGLELREDIDTVLAPGMVVSMEPMITVLEGEPGAGGYREHDILIVEENGAENITKFPFGPEHNIVAC